MDSSTWLTIGKITGVHGLAGNLKIWSFADSPDTFEKGRKVMIREEGANSDASGLLHTITKFSTQKKGIRLTLEGVNTREMAEALVGKEILMNKDQLPELEEDTWYWEDLIGLEVTDRDLGRLGTIDRIFPTGADDILVVTEAKAEILIPMNPHFVDEVDMEKGVVTTALPQGFILD
jgi:16S rRNA processing protein RimM